MQSKEIKLGGRWAQPSLLYSKSLLKPRIWGGRERKVAPGFHVPARSIWLDRVEKSKTELWLTGDADDPVQHSPAFSLLSTALQEAATPTAGTAPGYKAASSSSTAHTLALQLTPLELLHCKVKQLKASTCRLSPFPWLFGPEQAARDPLWSCPCSHAPAPAAATCRADRQDLCAVWSHWE